MENAASVSVRKGAWSSEEDDLLRDCIRKFGEGKWHELVPLRAGLNRCRKSCRLRWLNYLSPNIKRGCFGDDEVDLILRLHRLLGNRWSLIAGRLPGRTANDVKNFWNTNISKKPPRSAGETDRGKIITSSNIARPRPRTFSSNSQIQAWTRTISKSSPPLIEDDGNINEDIPTKSSQLPSSSAALPVDEEDLNECLRWWADLLYMTENGKEMEGIGDRVHSIANHDAVCGGKFDS